jgi:hypothetical protein
MIEVVMSTDKAPNTYELQASPTLLRGAETLDLYLGVIRQNIETLNAELDLLRAAHVERRELQRSTDSRRA